MLSGLTGNTAAICTHQQLLGHNSRLSGRQQRPLKPAFVVCSVSSDCTAVQLPQQAPAEPPLTVGAAAGPGAGKVLRALCHYAPLELADGPASLSKVRPYNAAEVQQALVYAQPLLHKLSLQQLSNVAGALAAAGHLDTDFMQQLGDVAAARLRAVPRVMQPTQGLRAFRVVCWLAVGFSRLGVLHAGLMEQVAVYATHLLQRCPLRFSKRRHGHQLALLAAAFAALQLYPPQLFRALGEHLKQHRQVVKLLGPQESMLLLWALARVGHRDPPAQLALTQRATTQVGQLTCQGLAHAYTQCAAVGLDAAPLLAALRKAVRVKLSSMQPADLTAILTALAALGQQDLLYLDETSKAIHNKLMNFTAGEISAAVAALAALRYRNPWLLERVSAILCNTKLRKAYQLTPEQLCQLLNACLQLGFREPLLLGHLGSVAVEAQLPGCSPAQLAAVLQAYCSLRFQQPQLLQAAATRLLQLVLQCSASAANASPTHQQHQRQHVEDRPSIDRKSMLSSQVLQLPDVLPHLIVAAASITSMPPAAGSRAEKAVLPAALLGLASLGIGASEAQWPHSRQLELLAGQTHGGSNNSVKGRSSGSSSNGSSGSRETGTDVGEVQGACSLQDLLQLLTAVSLYLHSHYTPAQAAPSAQGSSRQQDSQARLSELVQGLESAQAQLQQRVCQRLAAVEAAAAAAYAGELPQHCQGDALQCMQLLWLTEQGQQPRAAAGAHAAAPPSGHSSWRLGLSEQHVGSLVQQQLELLQQQQQQQGTLKPVAAAISALLQQQQQQQQQGLADTQVRLLHLIPDSPVVVPIAVLPSDASLATAATTDSNQQGALLSVAAAVTKRKLLLPDAAQAFITDSQQLQRPLAVFVAAQQQLGQQPWNDAWYTCSQPQQLLPAAEMWSRGLQATGWRVLVVLES